MVDQVSDQQKNRWLALALLRRYGWNSTSFQILEPDSAIGSTAMMICVAYRDTGRAWVAAGAPVAPPDRVAAVALSFVAAAAAHHRRACFFGTENRFATAVLLAAMRIGRVHGVGSNRLGRRNLREQTSSLQANRSAARATSVVVQTIDPRLLTEPASAIRSNVERLIARWEAMRGPCRRWGFLVQIHFHRDLSESRCFAATLESELVGLLSMVPVFARAGWLVEDLVRSPDAPNGTAELLIDAAMRAAAADGSRLLDAWPSYASWARLVRGWLRFRVADRRPALRFSGPACLQGQAAAVELDTHLSLLPARTTWDHGGLRRSCSIRPRRPSPLWP